MESWSSVKSTKKKKAAGSQRSLASCRASASCERLRVRRPPADLATTGREGSGAESYRVMEHRGQAASVETWQVAPAVAPMDWLKNRPRASVAACIALARVA